MGTTQKGRNDLKIASLRRDKEWVSHAREAALHLLNSPDGLDGASLLVQELDLFFGHEETDYLFKS